MSPPPESAPGGAPPSPATEAEIEAALRDQVHADAAAALARVMRPRVVAAGEDLVGHGIATTDLFFLMSGRWEVFLEEGATRLHLGHLEAGTWVGEAAFLNDQPTGAVVRAVTAGQAASLSRVRFHELMSINPRISSELMRQLCLVLAQRVHSSNAGLIEHDQGGDYVLTPEAPDEHGGVLAFLSKLFGGQHG